MSQKDTYKRTMAIVNQMAGTNGCARMEWCPVYAVRCRYATVESLLSSFTVARLTYNRCCSRFN